MLMKSGIKVPKVCQIQRITATFATLPIFGNISVLAKTTTLGKLYALAIYTTFIHGYMYVTNIIGNYQSGRFHHE